MTLERKHIITLSLFLIATLHSTIFSIFQLPNNFLMGEESVNLSFLKVILYATAISSSLINPYFGRKIGLRKTLYLGLLCNLLGLFVLLLHQWLGTQGALPLLLLNVLLFGIALTSVINCLVTYLILEFTKWVGLGVVVLFAFLNLGLMMAPLLVDTFQGLHQTQALYPFLIILVALSLWFVRTHFPNPHLPSHLAHLKRGTLIWKELHYRLGFYLLAIICYGLTETTFSLWGITLIQNILGAKTADETISLFWFFMVLAQFLLLIPLYFYKSIQVLISLVFIVMGAAYLFPDQTTIPGFISTLALGALGCSAIFPLLLSMMERELLSFRAQGTLLHYIEVGISLMLAGYFIGVGSVDLWVTQSPSPSIPPFHLAILFISITGLLAYFLHLTTPKRA